MLSFLTPLAVQSEKRKRKMTSVQLKARTLKVVPSSFFLENRGNENYFSICHSSSMDRYGTSRNSFLSSFLSSYVCYQYGYLLKCSKPVRWIELDWSRKNNTIVEMLLILFPFFKIKSKKYWKALWIGTRLDKFIFSVYQFECFKVKSKS